MIVPGVRHWGAVFLALFAGLLAVVDWIPDAAAQEPVSPDAHGSEAPADPNPESVAQVVESIPLEQVPERAEDTGDELSVLHLGEASRQLLASITSEIDLSLPKVASALAASRAALAARSEVRVLRQHEVELSELVERLSTWRERLDGQLAELRGSVQRLDALAVVWEKTDEAARRDDPAGTTATRTAAVRRDIEATRSRVVERRNQALAVRDRLVDPSSALTASLEQLRGAIDTRIRGIFRVDRPPLWSPEVRARLGEEWQTDGPKALLQRIQESGLYAREQIRLFVLQVVLLLGLGLGLRALRERAQARAEDDYNLRRAVEVFERPWAMALLIVLLLTTPLHPLAPRGVGFIASVLLAVVLLRISIRFLLPVFTPLVWALVIFGIVDRVRDFLVGAPTLQRVIFFAEMLGALAFLLWLLRPSRLAEIPRELLQTPFLRLFGATVRVAVVVLAVAIIADLAGFGDLTVLLGEGVLRSGFVGFFIFVLLMVVQGLAAFAFVLWPLRLLHSISRHRLLVRRRLDRALDVVAGGLWVTLVLGQVGLLDLARSSGGRVLGAGVSMGAFSLTLGDVLTFALTVWLSVLLARLLDFILQEDVFTRVQAGRGVPYAISGLVRYTVIFLGFLVGLAMMGVELTKLTVIAGGLGVGIGFGLQSVVNNFVSGLILLFERPIQVGDTVALPDCWGTMKHIGIRASVIHTFDGAEVIVPNGMLVSEKVTNWTLSDKRRRVELDVGVRYGTPAQQVIDLLLEVAQENPKVIDEPAPRAYFVAFGDSSLEFKLRAWSELFDDGYAIRSELAVAVQTALTEAGIAVPFPQRDLHLVSVSPDAASGLGGSPPALQRPTPTQTPDFGDES